MRETGLTRRLPHRTLYGVWNLSDFAASTYGIAPPLTVGHDGELELPCSEALWQARNEAEWNGARAAEADSRAMTVREACFLIADHNDRGTPLTSLEGTALRWSPFAIVCIMHIFSTRLWHVSHETLSSAATARPCEAHQLEACFKAAVRQGAGRRCHDLIRACAERAERDRTLRCTRDARWQLADAADVLRVCYARSVPALARLDCDTLLRGGEDDVRAAVAEHVAAPLGRHAEFTLAAAVALDGLCVPLRYGTQFYRKSGALNGSLEHLVAGWDNGESGAVRSFIVLGTSADRRFVLKLYSCQNGQTWSVARRRSAPSWTTRSGSCCEASTPCSERRRRSPTTAAPSRRACCGTGPRSTRILGSGEVSLNIYLPDFFQVHSCLSMTVFLS